MNTFNSLYANEHFNPLECNHSWPLNHHIYARIKELLVTPLLLNYLQTDFNFPKCPHLQNLATPKSKSKKGLVISNLFLHIVS